MVTMQLLAAERLAAAVNILVKRGKLDARSLPGDELLNYYQMFCAPEIPSEEESWAILRIPYKVEVVEKEDV
jgi:hypothetical protein